MRSRLESRRLRFLAATLLAVSGCAALIDAKDLRFDPGAEQGNPDLKNRNPEEFVDHSLMDELEKEGFFKKLGP